MTNSPPPRPCCGLYVHLDYSGRSHEEKVVLESTSQDHRKAIYSPPNDLSIKTSSDNTQSLARSPELNSAFTTASTSTSPKRDGHEYSHHPRLCLPLEIDALHLQTMNRSFLMMKLFILGPKLLLHFGEPLIEGRYICAITFAGQTVNVLALLTSASPSWLYGRELWLGQGDARVALAWACSGLRTAAYQQVANSC